MRLFFDKGDYELLAMLDGLRQGASSPSAPMPPPSLETSLHPHGVKELCAPKELRVAHAMICLLKSLDEGSPKSRLEALRRVRDEVLANEQPSFKLNTARVLLQTVKELVRCEDAPRRLELAHRFRSALSGKPRLIRAMLKENKLLEMPEDWTQIAFDDHVHDARTKGRKTATHLVMDAWIKGLRSMTVIYYDSIGAEAARELLEAGRVMGVAVKIGVEFPVRMSSGLAHLIWIPRGFQDADGFLAFLAKPEVKRFMETGDAVTRAASRKALDSLAEFNADGRLRLNERLSVKLPELSRASFENSLAGAPASNARMGEFVHENLKPLLIARAKAGGLTERELSELNAFDAESVSAGYLPESAHFRPEPFASPEALLEKLRQLPCGFRMTLNMSGMDIAGTLEALWRCRGAISHLELFNLKDHLAGAGLEGSGVDALRDALNAGSPIRLKRIVRAAFAAETKPERKRILDEMLGNLPALASLYGDAKLGVKIGSDSTERSRSRHGMGFALPETLPGRAAKNIKAASDRMAVFIPVKLPVRERFSVHPKDAVPKFLKPLARLPVLGCLLRERVRDFDAMHSKCRFSKRGNIVALGAMARPYDNGLGRPEGEGSGFKLANLNSGLLNGLKILLGFIPAFLTFMLTKDWWPLAWFGAFIWFGITGLRNILMSVLGGGGVFRSPLIAWWKLVDWNRLADSLMFTGFSVPLLDYLVKTLLLDKGLGITVSSSPIAVYTVMAVANGSYLASHNLFRGFPAPVAAANFFRSVLSIPIAWAFNFGLMALLGALGVPAPADALQKWAAIISKAASDCVAGLIEGYGDRVRNIRLRLSDYATLKNRMIALCARVETLFPHEELTELLKDSAELPERLRARDKTLWRDLAALSLDFLHLYWRKPRAQAALVKTCSAMDPEERALLLEAQKAALSNRKEMERLIEELFKGGSNSNPLRLYRLYSTPYLDALRKLR